MLAARHFNSVVAIPSKDIEYHSERIVHHMEHMEFSLCVTIFPGHFYMKKKGSFHSFHSLMILL